MDGVRLLSELSDDALLDQAEQLAARARMATAALLTRLSEIEGRGLHLRSGYGSLFTYCRSGLGLAEYSAYNRIEAAHVVRRFPAVLEMLRRGDVHLATVRLLGPHLTDENHAAVLASARGKSRAQVEEIVAGLAPRPDARPFVRKLPPPPDFRPPAPFEPMASPPPSTPAAMPAVPVPPATPAPPHPGSVVPLSPDRHRLQATLDGETVAMLELAQDLLRHALPSGDLGAIVSRALQVLVRELLKEKFAVTARPRGGGTTDRDSRHIPADVKRAVFLRDLGRCAYVGTLGRRCGARSFLEFHHVQPYMAGGAATEENIQLRCRPHNQYEGRLFFAREAPGDPPPAPRTPDPP